MCNKLTLNLKLVFLFILVQVHHFQRTMQKQQKSCKFSATTRFNVKRYLDLISAFCFVNPKNWGLCTFIHMCVTFKLILIRHTTLDYTTLIYDNFSLSWWWGVARSLPIWNLHAKYKSMCWGNMLRRYCMLSKIS